MLITVKIALLLFFQLNIFFILGNSFSRFFHIAKMPGIGISFASGFALYHSLFWFLAFPWSIFSRSFKVLACVWGILIILAVLICILLSARDLVRQYSAYIRISGKYFVHIIICILLTAIIFIIVTRNGFWDIDSQTYIGEVTTILDTDQISAFNPATGLKLSRWAFLHRGCAMFGAESAFWCKWFSIHPLIYCRIVRSSMNLFLLLAGTFGICRLIGFSTKNAFLFLMLSCPSFLLFNNSGYTNTRFLLHRGYEGKAYLGSTLLVFTVILCISYIQCRNRASYIALLLNEFATLSVSATALYLIPPVLAALVGAYIIAKKQWRIVPLLLLLIVPNLVFALLRFMG